MARIRDCVAPSTHSTMLRAGCAPPFAILLRQGYEGTSYGGQACRRRLNGAEDIW
ncbi:MAG: hypothetical protein ABIL62_12205 [Planctomycetota bacterium]